MGAVMTLLFALLLFVFVRLLANRRRTKISGVALPRWQKLLFGACTILLIYFIVKIVYEELYPCALIDNYYCNFAGTQYWNLFGWEF